MTGISDASNAIIAIALVVLAATGIVSAISRRARGFVFKKLLGGIVVLATQAKREEEQREAAEEQRRERVRQAVADLSAGINRKALLALGRLSHTAANTFDVMSPYQAVTVLKMECPELRHHLDLILVSLESDSFDAPAQASVRLIEPLIEGARSILGPAETLPAAGTARQVS